MHWSYDLCNMQPQIKYTEVSDINYISCNVTK